MKCSDVTPTLSQPFDQCTRHITRHTQNLLRKEFRKDRSKVVQSSWKFTQDILKWRNIIYLTGPNNVLDIMPMYNMNNAEICHGIEINFTHKK